MSIRSIVLVLCSISAGTVAACIWQSSRAANVTTSISDRQLPSGEFPFLSNRNAPFKQAKPNWLPDVPRVQLERNKQVVLAFYQGDLSLLADDFIQHDPGEPSTRAGWTKFITVKHPGDELKKPPPHIGDLPSDSAGRGLISMIAQGDIVVVLRKRNWNWPDGPEPIYSGIFVDVWRVQDGKLVEQWVSSTPADAVPSLIQGAKEGGYWNK